jgi:radical SAM protein with 4Fe4S-binding SPASM domain
MAGFFEKIRRRISPQKRDDRICSEIFESLSILADGSVTCSCVDIYEGRILGNVNRDSLAKIFDCEQYRELRRRMLSGNLPAQCKKCPVRVRSRTGKETVEAGPIRWLQIDPVFNCNLKCPDCALTQMRDRNYFIRPRTAISLELFKSIVNQAAPALNHIRFHMLGEPFLNTKARDMLTWVKKQYPDIFVSIETNGLLIGPDIQKSLVSARVDYVKFSIDGASQETFEKYRIGGDFQKAYENMAGLIRERNASGADRPRVVWQYILFRWNDSDEEIKKARQLAGQAGVDELYWLITHSRGASERFLPGKDHPELEGEKESVHVTIEIASRDGSCIPRPPATLEKYDPWK